MKIHPSAVIDPGAQLGTDVEIGPYSVVGAGVVIGDGCVLQSHVVIEGEVRLGRANQIGHGTVIGSAPQDLSFKKETRSRVEIGDGNIFREHCTVHRGTAEGSATVIGSHNFLMVGAHVGHNCRIGDRAVLANNCLLGGHVHVADRAFLGGGSVYHQFIRVGRLVITQGNSGFGQDIPPFVIGAQRNEVAGLNVIGLRRAGFSPAERDEIKRAFRLLYRSGLNARQALERSREMEWGALGREFFEFVNAAGKRGIVPSRRSNGQMLAGDGED